MQEEEKIEEYVLAEDWGEKKDKNWRERLTDFLNSRYFGATIIILVAIISFFLGRISGLEEKKPPLKIISQALKEESLNQSANISDFQQAAAVGASPTLDSMANSGQLVASKNGTKYHYPWCAGAKQISEKNLITFKSVEEARAAGYTPASNCKGLK